MIDDEGKLLWETVPVAAQQEMMDDTKPRAAGEQGMPVAHQNGLTDMDSTPLKRRIIEALKNAPHNLKIISDGASMLFSGTEIDTNPLYEVLVKASCGM